MSIRPLVTTALALLLSGCASLGLGGGPPDMGFTGNETYSEKELRAVVGLAVELEKREYRPSAVDDAAFAVEEFYGSQGFPFCIVEYELLVPPVDGRHATLVVDEGPRTELEGLELEGNESFSSSDLRAFLRAPTQDGRTWFSRRAVGDAARAIGSFYYSQGFLDVQVASPETSFSEDQLEARALVAIQEGPQYRLLEVRLLGDPIDTPDWTGLVDEPFTPRVGAAVRGRVIEALGSRGYPDAEVVLEEEREASGAVRLTATVSTGPQVTVVAIRVVGNEKTRESWVRSMLALKPGERWDSRKERESFGELYRSGVFSSVNLLLEGEGPERTLTVELIELTSMEWYLEPGYGSYERFRLGAGWRESNLLGTGRVLDLSASVSEFLQRGQLDLIDRRLFGEDIQSNFSLVAQRRVEPSFTDREFSAGLLFSKRYSDRLRGLVGYQYRKTDVLESRVEGPDLAPPDVDVSSILLAPTYDTRDQIFAPTKGGFSWLGFEFAAEGLGSQIDFLRTELRHSSFVPLFDGTVLGLSFRGGFIAPFGDTAGIPIQFRLFNGGENTVRSFRQDQLGPTDAEGTPVGGEAFTVLSAELRQRLQGPLQAAVFYDVGNVQLDWRDVLSFDDLESGVGVGLRYLLPIGAVRLDYAVNPDPAPGDEDSVLHLTVGMAF